MNKTEREAIARRALERSTADQTEVRISSSDDALTRFTHGISNQNLSTGNVTVAVRAIVDGRTGVASSNDLSDASIDALLSR
ncbi:MAG: DNA gyrase modulator, partial [Candidatus Aquilonibacter sp.]